MNSSARSQGRTQPADANHQEAFESTVDRMMLALGITFLLTQTAASDIHEVRLPFKVVVRVLCWGVPLVGVLNS